MLLGSRFVPPAPQVLAQLYADYLRYRATTRKPISFKRYLKRIGFTDPTARFKGGDDGMRRVRVGAVKLVAVPKRAVSGTVRVIVLLVDFPDKPATRNAHEFEDMLFSTGTFASHTSRPPKSMQPCCDAPPVKPTAGVPSNAKSPRLDHSVPTPRTCSISWVITSWR